MEALVLYVLKANLVLALFAAAYYGLLRRLTFFGPNRAYLLFALAFAAVYPLLPMPALLPAAGPLLLVLPAAPSALGPASAPAAPGLDWWQLAGTGYAAGVAVLLLRLLGQLLSLGWLRRQARPAVVLGQAVRVVPGAGGPFSFGGTIYLTESALANQEALGATLRHEQAHVRQWHTLDVLLWQLATAAAWLNPAAWLLRRAALDNLEFLADRAALRSSGLPQRAYQYLLVAQQTGGVPAPALAFQFSLLTLKNRIQMLNQPLSSPGQLGRYLLAAPLVVALALGYSGARAQPAVAATANNGLPADALYYLDGQPSTATALKSLNPNTISRLDVVKDQAVVQQVLGSTTTSRALVITTVANANSPAVLALASKLQAAQPYTEEPAKINALVPKTLAYITSYYPDSRLGGEVSKLTAKATGEVKYRVQLVTGKRPFYVYFSPQGDFLGE